MGRVAGLFAVTQEVFEILYGRHGECGSVRRLHSGANARGRVDEEEGEVVGEKCGKGSSGAEKAGTNRARW